MTVTTFQDFPLADADRPWDGDAADKRVREWADAQERPTPDYRSAHVWYDGDQADEYGAYKLLIVDIVDGEPRAVPRAIRSAGGVLQGARGGVNLPEGEVDRVKAHLAKYYAKMDDQAPWEHDS
jgi:hypothetical protein